MPPQKVNHAGLRYFAEEAARSAMEAHGNFATVNEALRDFVHTYAALVDQAGRHAADLLTALPYAKEEGGYMDAYIGLHILEHARAALRELLEEDETMRGLIDGYYTTTRAEDADARREARRYDLEHNADKQAHFHDAARAHDAGKPTDDDIADSAAGGDRHTLDAHVEAAQDRLTATADIRVYQQDTRTPVTPAVAPQGVPAGQSEHMPLPQPQDAEQSVVPGHVSQSPAVPAPAAPVVDDPAVRLFAERPTRITVQAPDYARQSPSAVFRGVTQWLFEHLIMVASGSRKRDSFPRIAPLISADLPIDYAVSLPELQQLTADIRHHVGKLRLPDDGGAGSLRAVLDGLDPRDPDAVQDAMGRMLDMLGGARGRTSPYGESAMDGGEWCEGEGDDWRGEDAG